jgi:hypothetical protein
MANDTIEKSVPMAGGGGANAALPSNPVPVAAAKAPATLKPKNTAPAKPKAPTSAMDTFLKPSRTAINRTQYNEKLADIDGNLIGILKLMQSTIQIQDMHCILY